MADAKAEDFFSWQRTKKSAEIDGVGTIYFYDPPTVAERDAYQKHARVSSNDEVSISLEAIVDGIIARVKKADSSPMFFLHHKSMLMEMSYERLQTIWKALGGSAAQPAAPLIETAAKK